MVCGCGTFCVKLARRFDFLNFADPPVVTVAVMVLSRPELSLPSLNALRILTIHLPLTSVSNTAAHNVLLFF